MAKIELDGGKYTVVNELSEGGGFYALRYGRVWSNLAGDKLALSMFHEIERLRQAIREIQNITEDFNLENAEVRLRVNSLPVRGHLHVIHSIATEAITNEC